MQDSVTGNVSLLNNSVYTLQKYIEEHEYKGYDPYDGLKSPLFKLPVLRSNKLIRFYSQQLIKRIPVNLRPLLFIRPGLNPVTLGLCIQGYCNIIKLQPEQKSHYISKIEFLINSLEQLIPEGYKGVCWGYDFDWEARYASIPAYKPTVVATGIIANALCQAYEIAGNKRAAELLISSTRFILNDLFIFTDAEKDICFSYSPFDRQKVFNASMKGARTLAQAYSINGDENLKTMAKKAVNYVVKHQRNDGAWIYSENKIGGWIDNYHTGYILDSLDEYIKRCLDVGLNGHLEKGFNFYLSNFFGKDGIPHFYDKEKYPIDCTAAAQSILTLERFNHREKALQVAEWMISNMQHPKGYFYFRKQNYYTVKTPFMRWSQAWMFAALTSLLTENKK